MGSQKNEKKAQIVQVSRTPAAAAGVHCANCGAIIGNLETACVWQDQPVCHNCYNRLASQTLAAAPQQDWPWPEQVQATPQPRPQPHPQQPPPQQIIQIIHAHAPQPIYVVTPQKKGRAISVAGWALILIGLPLLCIGGIGLIPLIAGIVLIIVGACTGS